MVLSKPQHRDSLVWCRGSAAPLGAAFWGGVGRGTLGAPFSRLAKPAAPQPTAPSPSPARAVRAAGGRRGAGGDSLEGPRFSRCQPLQAELCLFPCWGDRSRDLGWVGGGAGLWGSPQEGTRGSWGFGGCGQGWGAEGGHPWGGWCRHTAPCSSWPARSLLCDVKRLHSCFATRGWGLVTTWPGLGDTAATRWSVCCTYGVTVALSPCLGDSGCLPGLAIAQGAGTGWAEPSAALRG